MPAGRGEGEAAGRLAPAKVNLALHVTGRRSDGYHEIDTLAAFADFGDTVAVAPAAAIRLSPSGPFAGRVPAGSENLAWRAATLLQRETGTAAGADIRLDKRLPAGAGLGGGSADAAATLLALDALWRTRLSRRRLTELGLRLGADVPMCLHGRALRAGGIGEVVESLPGVPALPLVLVWPGVELASAAVFAALEDRSNPPLPEPPAGFAGPAELAEWLAGCRNDLQEPAIRLAPVVADGLAALTAAEGCLLGRMSGSGSACFGLFATGLEAERAAAAIAAARPGWWVCATTLR